MEPGVSKANSKSQKMAVVKVVENSKSVYLTAL